MKLLAIFILGFILQSNALETKAQDKRLNLQFENNSLKEVLQKLEDQTEFSIIYKDELVNSINHISGNFKDEKVTDLMNKILQNTGLTYTVKGRAIIIVPNESNLLTEQQKSVSGKVTDTSGNSLPGVSVVVKGSTIGAITDANGNFSFSNLPANATLQFSFVGMKTQEIKVEGKSSINVTLTEESIGLDEVVAVGYGTQRKSDLTGSVASVSAKNIKASSALTIDKALQGRTAGVNVFSNTGAPGGNVSIQIRGVNSTSGDGANEPLYVVDGIPLSNDDNMSGRGFTRSGTLNSPLAGLNPNDIETMEILKDASATAIYGARAANGVVIITTKTGKAGAAKVSLDYSYGLQNVIKKLEMCNFEQYAEMYVQSIDNYNLYTKQNGVADRVKSPYMVKGTPEYEIYKANGNTNWQDAIFRTAPMQDVNLSVNGGTEKLSYSISGGLTKQSGIILTTDNSRATLRTNLDLQANKWLKIGTKLNLSREWGNMVTSGENYQGIDGIWQGLPFFKVYNTDGTYWENTEAPYINMYLNNPINLRAKLEREKQQTTRNRFIGSAYAEVRILPDLTFKSSIGADLATTNQYVFQPFYNPNSFINNNSSQVDIRNYNTYNIVADQILNYLKKMGDHSIGAMLGFSYQQFYRQSETMSAKGSTDPRLDQLSNQPTMNYLYGDRVYSGLVSQFGRANYSYKNKYLVTATIRRDGSSRFGPNKKYGIFPSASIGWKVSEEDFLRSIKQISNLKIRASYGKTGNQNIGNFSYLARTGSLTTVWGNTDVAAISTTLANPDLRWEENIQKDMGLELGLFDQRIQLEIDYYHKKSKGLLVNVPIPGTAGAQLSETRNAGSVENRGWEFMLSTQNFKGKFSWNTDFNISFNKNKVLDIGKAADGSSNYYYGLGLGNDAPVNRTEAGHSIGEFYLIKYDGVYQTQAEVDALPVILSTGRTVCVGAPRYIDQNGDKKIDDLDRVYVGSPLPKFTGGINNTFSYKGLSLSVFLNFVYGNKIYSNMLRTLEKGDGYWNQTKWYYDHYWRKDKPSDIGMPFKGPSNSNAYGNVSNNNDRALFDGSYLRIKNITLSYQIPKSIVNRVGLSNLKIYSNIVNLFTLTKYRGIDPDVNSQGANPMSAGVDNYSYPNAKTITFGMNLEF